jgi:subfamily B ATP-binding cassette protein MsbA
MRRQVEEHVARLPVRYFDSTQAGQLLSRIMTDAEGIRNLVGTGLVQLTGSVVTAVAALGFLFYLNWRLTIATIAASAAAWRSRSSGCARCSASAARSTRRSRAG